jgi:hypothetical protein
MAGIIDDPAQGIRKDCRCFIEMYSVLGKILGGFLGIPFERYGHGRIYRNPLASA